MDRQNVDAEYDLSSTAEMKELRTPFDRKHDKTELPYSTTYQFSP